MREIEPYKIKIADRIAQVTPLFESTKAYCQKYLCDGDADFYITVTADDLIFEQEMLDIEAREEGLKLRKFTAPFLERAAIQRKLAGELVKHDILLLHGSTVAVDGQAYLFTAACGTGKSTHTRLWRETFGDRAAMVNDDKPFLAISANGVTAYGSPWSGKHGLDSNIAVPLKGICILYRGDVNEIHEIQPKEATAMLRHQSFLAQQADEEKVYSLVDRLMEQVSLWEMRCTKSQEAAITAHAAMSGK